MQDINVCPSVFDAVKKEIGEWCIAYTNKIIGERIYLDYDYDFRRQANTIC